MFSWLKRLIGRSESSQRADVEASPPAAARGKPRELMQVVDAFLTQNPQPTLFGVHALIAAGAADLRDSETVLEACERIAVHGYQFPLNPTLRRELKTREILPYLQWQARNKIDPNDYLNENTILALVERFRR